MGLGKRVGVVVAVMGLLAAGPARGVGEGALRDAMSRTYIHGVTPELAASVAGSDSSGLIDLLLDESFARRDNVVAFLTYLGDEAAADALLAFLADPPAPLAAAEEDRAALLAPRALGMMASRGSDRALDALLEMTRDGGNGGVLAAAAAKAPHPSRMRDDLLEMAIEGLRLSGRSGALDRLRAIEAGAVTPAAAGRSLRPAARRALRPATPATEPSATTGDLAAAVAGALDPSGSTHDHGIDYASHVDVTNPMTDQRLDECLDLANLRIGRADFSEDVACCNTLTRAAPGRSFGSPGDGLDIIDSSTEVGAVLNDPTARVKVVRAINYCGGAGTNIIGCGWVGGKGIAVVRRSNLESEAVLWAHEYGHNVGLSHNADSRYIMHGIDYGTNHAVSPEECDRFHAPSSGAQANLAVLGICAESDGDGVHDLIDNCPAVANFDQADADGNGVGDACELGCGNGVVDEPSEQCDGADLGGASCAALGLGSGLLGCTASCQYDTTGCTTCGNGAREAGEACDGADLGGASCADIGCTSGSPQCTASCTIDYAACASCPICDGDGVCEAGENCVDCASDCFADAGTSCGNGVCDIATGEDCVSCPADCRGVQTGKPANRYCCGAGGGSNPLGCDDPVCTQGTWVCSAGPVVTVASCCGDGTCTGVENSFNCDVDCTSPPQCGSRGDACTTDGECCSGRCRVRRGARSCG